MSRATFIFAFLFLTLGTTVSRACQFDLPGQSHEQWLEWVAARNEKNAQGATGQLEAKVTKDAKKAVKSRAVNDGYRAPRTLSTGGNTVTRVGR